MRVLRRCALLAGVGNEAVSQMAEGSERVTIERRDCVFAQGDAGMALFVVDTGRVRCLRRAADGREMTIGYRGPGDLFGECCLLEWAYRSEARAMERVEAVRVPTELMQRMLAAHPTMAIELLKIVDRRRHVAEGRLEAVLTRSVESRLAQFLLEVADQHGLQDPRGTLIGVKYTHQEMANYVGSTRETVTLLLGELKRRQIILTDQRRVVVVDRATLAALV